MGMDTERERQREKWGERNGREKGEEEGKGGKEQKTLSGCVFLPKPHPFQNLLPDKEEAQSEKTKSPFLESSLH